MANDNWLKNILAQKKAALKKLTGKNLPLDALSDFNRKQLALDIGKLELEKDIWLNENNNG